MYKQFFIFLITITISNTSCTNGFAQNQSYPNKIVANTSGNTVNLGSMIVDWNLGQVFTKSFTDQRSILLTSGFLQSKENEMIKNPSLDSLSDLDLKYHLISVYPNPTSNHQYIFNSQDRIKIVEMSLVNIKGELVKVFDPPFSTPTFNKKISLFNFASGTYVLVLNYIIDNRYYRTKYFRIIKM